MFDIKSMRRTNNDIFRQLEELIIENEQLKKENKKLRAENRCLRTENARRTQRLEALETDIEDRINKAVEDAVAKATAPLLETIAEKDKEILRLKAQIGKNSSKPSSSNGFKKIPNNREKSEKKHGGQPGHKGCRLDIPKNLDELVKEGKAEHIILSDVADGEAYVSDWTVDVKTIIVYTEHRRSPGKPPEIEYGLQLKAQAVYLSMVGLIAYKRLSQFFCETSNNLLKVSKATLANFNHSAAKSVCLSGYINDLLNGTVIHVDETPVRTSERCGKNGIAETAGKSTYQVYIRTYSNRTTTVLTASPNKTEDSVITDNILTQFHGIVAQDHEAKFYHFGNKHATCGAHLTRELKGMLELQILPWAGEVRQFFLEMNEQKKKDLHSGKKSCEAALLCHYESRYDELVNDGKNLLAKMEEKSFGYDELRRMVNRLEKYKDNYLLFMRDYEAPFTNNEAERDLRHCKTRQKVSGCFRSWQGVVDYCNIHSLLATAKKRGQNLLNTLASLFSKQVPAEQ
jgi:transposase